MNQQAKQCQNCNNPFTIESDDFAFYERIDVPPPTLCPDCRYQRRLTNRNEWNFYRRKCDLCGKDMVSIYNTDFKGPVYCQLCWWGDSWDPHEYGQDFDFSRNFFEQFHDFRLKVPRVAMANWLSVNSEYSNQSLGNKNCYMCVTAGYCENCLYGYGIDKVRESVDCYNVMQSELLYESMQCVNCSNSAFLEDCSDTTDSYFLKNCRGCTSCFGCYGLRNKSFYWKNQPLSKEEYQKKFSEFMFTHSTIQNERRALADLAQKFPHKYFHGRTIINSTGDDMQNVKNSHAVFRASDAENLRYCQDANFSQDSIDATEVWCELGYELEGAEAKNSIAVTKCVALFDCYYSELCSDSHDLLGCVGLKKAEYCILNKQYSREAYRELKDKIVEHMKKTGEWGEFFPSIPSLFAYNESTAQDYFPLTEKEALTKGMRWFYRQDREYTISLPGRMVPKSIDSTDKGIVDQTIGCISQDSETVKKKYPGCATAFRITPAEFSFYQKMHLPVPQKCPICRRQDRMSLRNPRKLWKRSCQCTGAKSENGIYYNQSNHFHNSQPCPSELETSYAPDHPEIVYCESCYQSEAI